ncbi:hypothetical protein TRIUR3_11074 [Triticum urartu]|uniref:Transmembrane protein 184C n=1 Tax=Triticum urartu TaxID=4572 RepID=M7ZAJ9_TRIUA|nr:hypothetical protein TRIUR3_11074 [Triticum urartu]
MTSNGSSSFQGFYRNLHTPAVLIGAGFVLVALLISLWLILQHLRSYRNPSFILLRVLQEQKWIIAVLFMVPVYASESIISLWHSEFSLACDILRNCYEAFALYAFGRYLVACLGNLIFFYVTTGMDPNNMSKLHGHCILYMFAGGERQVVGLLEKERMEELSEQLLESQEKAKNRNQSRLRDFFCDPNAMGESLYTIIKFGLVQYMILKTFCAFLAFILELFGAYGDGEFKWNYGYPYIALVINFSQTWALYCLVKFYNATHERLQAIRPLAKFISFKAIVFATWWQGIGITIICHTGLLPKEGKVQNGIQDFLICIEMAIAAIAHAFVFGVEPYQHIPVHDREHREVAHEESKMELRVDVDDGSNAVPATVEQKETNVKTPGTSIRESVEDVVLGGGHHVVKDVALTISQAMEPVEKGAWKIQETFHHVSLKPEDKKKPDVEVEERVTENVVDNGEAVAVDAEVEVETRVKDKGDGSGSMERLKSKE